MRNLCSLVLLALCSVTAGAESSPAVQLSLDTSEAEQCLRILHKQAAHEAITAEDWQRLFTTVPYEWLKAREASMGRAFTDQEFQTFLLSPESLATLHEWEQTVAAMKRADLTALGIRMLAWLPARATINARVFPEIKPRHNSFVWKKSGEGPAIFLYVERQTQAQFENTVAHECHHIGLNSLEEQQDGVLSQLPPKVKTTVHWLGAFGEGEAMLAAAGSDDVHPHWADDALARARWDSDMTHFNADIASLQQLFTDILDGRLQGDDEIRKRADAFWGYQGAWYTVGYEMAVLVDRQYGRQAFTDCLLDTRQLLVLYNQIAQEANAKGASLATWSPDLLARLQAHN